MTNVNNEYSKPEIIRKSGKSDIFHQMPSADSPRKSVLDRNASTVFSRDPIPSARPGRKQSTYGGSDIFYQSKPINHYEAAAPSAEKYYEPAEPSYEPAEARYEPSSGPPKADYMDKAHYAAQQIPSLASFEEKLIMDRNVKKQLHQQMIHSNIFSDNIDSIPSRGRRHYNSISAPTDIFNVSRREEMAKSRRDTQLPPEWKAGTSFSNLFGGSADSLYKESSRARRNRVEPSIISRPSGLSSEDLNKDRVLPQGRLGKSQDQFKSQIWF